MLMMGRRLCGMLIGLMGLWINSRVGGVCLRSIECNRRLVFNVDLSCFCCCDFVLQLSHRGFSSIFSSICILFFGIGMDAGRFPGDFHRISRQQFILIDINLDVVYWDKFLQNDTESTDAIMLDFMHGREFTSSKGKFQLHDLASQHILYLLPQTPNPTLLSPPNSLTLKSLRSLPD